VFVQLSHFKSSVPTQSVNSGEPCGNMDSTIGLTTPVPCGSRSTQLFIGNWIVTIFDYLVGVIDTRRRHGNLPRFGISQICSSSRFDCGPL
jgi:hypothetical protein